MSDLHWLVTDGPKLYAVLFVIALAVGAWRAGRAVRCVALRRTADERARLGTPAASPDAAPHLGPITLAGTLRSAEDIEATAIAVATARFASELGVEARTTLEGPLVLVTSNSDGTSEAIPLDGPFEVNAGSIEAMPHARAAALHREIREATGPGAVPANARVRAISFGDRVIVRGVLEREPSPRETTYRSQRSRHRIVAPEGSTVRLAFAAEPRVLGPRLAHVAALSLLWGMAFITGTTVLAEFAYGRGEPRAGLEDTREMLPGSRLTAMTIVAATPVRRRAALRKMSEALRVEREPSMVRLQRASDLQLLLGDCNAASSVWANAKHPAEASTVWYACTGAGHTAGR
jgi:hypothetical protein